MFFCSSAAPDGRVNISPKGMDSLRVIGPNRIIWRNLSGSGNETAAHLSIMNRMTLMWCGFATQSMIMRVYGTARILHPRDADFAVFNSDFSHDNGARQIYDMAITVLQTSCGYAVPFFDYQGERDVLAKWSETKGAEGIKATWARDNQYSIDGMPTHILKDTPDA